VTLVRLGIILLKHLARCARISPPVRIERDHWRIVHATGWPCYACLHRLWAEMKDLLTADPRSGDVADALSTAWLARLAQHVGGTEPEFRGGVEGKGQRSYALEPLENPSLQTVALRYYITLNAFCDGDVSRGPPTGGNIGRFLSSNLSSKDNRCQLWVG